MAEAPTEAIAPPAVLQLAGHPLRWLLLSQLARSDRTVRELTDRVGQPQNVVSYHLGKLRNAGLVSARRSSADGRDAYYSAALPRLGDQLAATGEALHPGLRLGPTPPAEAAPARVLFLCTGNSARSQMAEALTRVRSDGRVEAHSAGSHPKPLHPDAVRVMRDEHDIDIAGVQSKHLSEFADEHFDQVVSLCDKVREVCPEFPGHPETVHWSIPDPSADGYPAFQATADELATRIGFLLAALASTTTKEQS